MISVVDKNKSCLRSQSLLTALNEGFSRFKIRFWHSESLFWHNITFFRSSDPSQVSQKYRERK